MATVADIEAAILRVAGNPEAGPIKALAGAMAEEIAKLDHPAQASKPAKEKRVIEALETRDLEA